MYMSQDVSQPIFYGKMGVVLRARRPVDSCCPSPRRKFQDSAECAECSTEAMGLGLEALNAALSCAEVRGPGIFMMMRQRIWED